MTEPCADKRLLLTADLDGELDAGRSAELHNHMRGCPGCAALRDDLLSLRRTLATDIAYHRVPHALRQKLAPSTKRETAWRLPAGFAGGALAAGMALLLLPHSPDAVSTNELLASHLRALQPGHLTDVASNDQHNVKPWFDGKLDFAPPVRDVSAQGFVLDGGRLDYVGGRTVAVLVYLRQKHVIDLYVRPDAPTAVSNTANGYNIVSWTQNGFAFTAISDLNINELQQFADAFQAQS